VRAVSFVAPGAREFQAQPQSWSIPQSSPEGSAVPTRVQAGWAAPVLLLGLLALTAGFWEGRVKRQALPGFDRR
jgi:hypothetical protein